MQSLQCIRDVVATRDLITMAASILLGIGLAAPMPADADDRIAPTADDAMPLQAGDMAPEFTVRTVDDEAFVFDPDALDRPAVIITFRGGWCPFCNMYLSELHTVVPQIREAGVDILFLSGDRPEILYSNWARETQETIDGLDYTILSDADAQAAIALGIAFREDPAATERRRGQGRDLDGSSQDLHGILPVPAVFAIGTDGVIEFAFSNPDFKVRLPADELLRVARDLANNQ